MFLCLVQKTKRSPCMYILHVKDNELMNFNFNHEYTEKHNR